jgi:hypothetical protein
VVSDRGEVPVIEFLASIEPASLPLLAVLAFSVTLIPVGLMLGSPCSPCCQCSACVAGALPNTVTVTLSGLPDTRPGPDLLSVSIQGCTGFGATAVARAPSGDAPPGPITAIEVTNGGSGYATINRVQPTVTAAGPDGTGAELEVTLTETTDFCGIPYWEVTGVTVTQGGEGYTDGQIVFSVSEGDTESSSAFATAVTGAIEPTLQLAAFEDRGSGAVLVPVLNQSGFDPDKWEIQSVTVTDGGTGYQDGDLLQVVVDANGIEESSAFLVITTVRDEDFNDTGVIDSVQVFFGGSYYQSTGEIVAVNVFSGGEYYRENPAGQSYLDDVTIDVFGIEPGDGSGATFAAVIDGDPDSPTFGQITGITVTNGGDGYLEFKDQQVCCGDFYNGRPFVLKRKGVPAEPLESAWPTSVNGLIFFPDPPDECRYEHRFCGMVSELGTRGSLNVYYLGPSQPAVVELVSQVLDNSLVSFPRACNANRESRLLATENIDDCSAFSFTATNDAGVSATVEPGGEYDPDDGYAGQGSCFICCQGTDQLPEEISVSWTNDESDVPSGTYVLERLTALDSPNIRVWSGFGLSARLRSCGTLSEDAAAFEPLLLPGGDECDDCHRSCITFATITFLVQSFGFSAIITETSLAGDNPATCGDCQETPLCAPSSGTYVIQGKGTMTIS